MSSKSGMKQLQSLPYLFVLCLLLASLPMSCESEPPKLRKADYKLIDTLVKEQTGPLRPVLDSLCDLRFANEVERARDSIFELRYQEFTSKLGK